MDIIRPLLGTNEFKQCEWIQCHLTTKLSLEFEKQNFGVSRNEC